MELKVKQVKRHDGVREALYFPALFVGFRLTVKHFWRNLFGSRGVVTINYLKKNVSLLVMLKMFIIKRKSL